jgi:hypothetical protein
VVAVLAVWQALGAGSASAITVTLETNATNLANALIAGGGTGLAVTSATLSGHSFSLGASSGTYTNATGTYGIGAGIVISTGNVGDYGDGSNTLDDFTTSFLTLCTGSGNDCVTSSSDAGVPATPAQQALLDPIINNLDAFDVTELTITFDMQPGFDTVFFNVVFGSEEFDEFVGLGFSDGFGLFVNSTNIATVGGNPVNIEHPDMAVISGTELDGVLAPNGNPVILFSHVVGDGTTGNTLKFIIADASDGIFDTTAYVSALGGTPPSPVPGPSTLLLLGSGLAGLGGLLSWRRARPARPK